MPKIVNIIQARMGSTRFSGKMMALLQGEPVIDWIFKRCLKSSLVNETWLATSDLARDDILADRAVANGVHVFRGDEEDVLSRYSAITTAQNADIVVRVCGDRPLVDPEAMDLAINFYMEKQPVDLVYNHISGGGQNWPRGFGVEVLSGQMILDAGVKAVSVDHREHVTAYFWQRPDLYTLSPVLIDGAINPRRPDIKLDLDTREDLARLNALTGLGIDCSMVGLLNQNNLS
jgi:spore coat polysaccharide biosynthesis protein SpsF